jgi:hypothetical protein
MLRMLSLLRYTTTAPCPSSLPQLPSAGRWLAGCERQSLELDIGRVASTADLRMPLAACEAMAQAGLGTGTGVQ